MSDENEFVFVWNVEDITLHCNDTYEIVNSPLFTAENIGGSLWELHLFPGGANDLTEDYVSCFLSRSDKCKYSKEKITVDFDIKLYLSNGILFKSYESKDAKFGLCDRVGKKKFIKRRKLSDAIKNCSRDLITFVCTIRNSLQASYCGSQMKTTFNEISLTKSFRIPNSPEWTKTFHCTVPGMKTFELTLTAPDDDILISFKEIKEGRVVVCRISLLDVYDVKHVSESSRHYFSDENDWKFPTFFTKTLLKQNKDILVKNGEFTLLIECSCSLISGKDYVEPLTYGSNCSSNSVTTNKYTCLRNDFRSLFVSMKHADVEIRTGNKSFFAHKSILSVRSPIFSTILDQQMLKKENFVNCQDISSGIMYSFLEFLYTGSMSETEVDRILQLLMVAHKYQVTSLKNKCADFLISVMSPETVLQIIQVADVTELNSLKISSLDYIRENYVQIITSTRWSEWGKENSKLITEIILQLSTDLKNSYNQN